MSKKIILITTIIIVFAGIGIYFVLNRQSLSPQFEITNFEECARAGYPIGESYPRQCFAPNKTFVEEVDTAPGVPSSRAFDGCKITGCSGQVCSDQEVITTCEFRPEYACYQNTICERQSNNKCGWTMTATLRECLTKSSAFNKEIIDGSGQSGTGTIQPDDPEKVGLAPYPDLPLASFPQEPVPIKFVVEHRSALNGKTIAVRGTIVGTLLGEKACPPDRGMCAQPSIFLADTSEKNRNPLYDLRVIVGEEEQEKNYPIGKIINLQVAVDGNKTSVTARKIY